MRIFTLILLRLVNSEEHVLVYDLVVTEDSRLLEVRIVLCQNLIDRSVGIVSDIDIHENAVIALWNYKISRRAYLYGASLDVVVIRIDRIGLISAVHDFGRTVFVIADLICLAIVNKLSICVERLTQGNVAPV